MRNTHTLLLVLLFGLFLGCSKDGDDKTANETKALDKNANLKGTGESANDLLSNDKFTKLLIEIAYVDGYKPTEEAMDGFVSYVKARTFKEDVELKYTVLESPGEESLTLDEIAELESKNRTVYNQGETLAVYIYFADAPAEGDDEDEGLVTLGAVFRNTSMIIHEATVRKLADQSFFITDADVENSTLNHEFGHLFGLVNLGTTPVNDHEDVERDEDGKPILDENGKTNGNSHCNVEGCLMRAELQFGGGFANKSGALTAKDNSTIKSACSLSGKSVLKLLESQVAKGFLPEPPNLDSECLLDLKSNGGR
ncbi:hypothetical protein D9O36_07720 [Zobellia amurskyensis]|uniref:Membrane metalloprotease n=1 Tax=Zobellia amurskyensis TaxID=248905 RepID=A0A7X2ZSS4_9FLAO|nr:hypothetical protein [Zobellia amurskyensis]MUH35723.1 hypothetical protein [Zobellia amurskyensis]